MSARELISQPSEEQQTANALAEQYTNRHVAMEHYILVLFIVFSFLRFIKIDPQSWKGPGYSDL